MSRPNAFHTPTPIVPLLGGRRPAPPVEYSLVFLSNVSRPIAVTDQGIVTPKHYDRLIQPHQRLTIEQENAILLPTTPGLPKKGGCCGY